MCSHVSLFDPVFVEEVLSKRENDWFIGQNIYPMLVARRPDLRFEFFDRDEYQASGVFKEGAVFRHYWSSIPVFSQVRNSRMQGASSPGCKAGPSGRPASRVREHDIPLGIPRG